MEGLAVEQNAAGVSLLPAHTQDALGVALDLPGVPAVRDVDQDERAALLVHEVHQTQLILVVEPGHEQPGIAGQVGEGQAALGGVVGHGETCLLHGGEALVQGLDGHVQAGLTITLSLAQ